MPPSNPIDTSLVEGVVLSLLTEATEPLSAGDLAQHFEQGTGAIERHIGRALKALIVRGVVRRDQVQRSCEYGPPYRRQTVSNLVTVYSTVRVKAKGRRR